MKRVLLRKVLSVATTVALAAMACTGALAQDAPPDNALRIATGPVSGVYTQLARDMQKVCGQLVPMVSVPSKGGLDNLMLLSASAADIGFAQIDLMQRMGKDGDQNIKELQAVMSMHANLLHIITRTEGSKVGEMKIAGKLVPYSGTTKVFQKLSDLKEASVALVGSAQLLGQTLERQLGYNMVLLKAESDDEALVMLQSNQVQAIFTTGGWPYPPVARLDTNSGQMLADYDLAPQAPFVATKRNYPKLGVFNQSFLSATNLLLSRPFKPGGERGKMVAALQKCVIQHLDELQEGPYHAAWKEIKTPLDTLGVTMIARPEANAVAPGRAKVPVKS
jgi:hypothetical protein